MSTAPEQLRAQIEAVLAELPDTGGTGRFDGDLDEVARRLEEAHDLLVHALESVEKG